MYGYKVAGRQQVCVARVCCIKLSKAARMRLNTRRGTGRSRQAGSVRHQGRNSKFEWQRLAAAKPKTGCALWQQTRVPRDATVWQSAPQSVYACFDFALLSAAIWFVPPNAARPLGQHTSRNVASGSGSRSAAAYAAAYAAATASA